MRTSEFFSTHRVFLFVFAIVLPASPVVLPALIAQAIIDRSFSFPSVIGISILSAISLLTSSLFHSNFSIYFTSSQVSVIPLSIYQRLAIGLIYRCYIHSVELALVILSCVWVFINKDNAVEMLFVAIAYIASTLWGSLYMSNMNFSIITRYGFFSLLAISTFFQDWYFLLGFIVWSFLARKINVMFWQRDYSGERRHLVFDIAKSTGVLYITIFIIVCFIFCLISDRLGINFLFYSLTFMLLILVNNLYLKVLEYFQRYRKVVAHIANGDVVLRRYCYWVGAFVFLCIISFQVSTWFFLPPPKPYLIIWSMSFVFGFAFVLINKKYILLSQAVGYVIFALSYL